MINKFIIEDVRCFAEKQELEIRPLTFLVGENSTGKSTVLGCFQAMHSLFSKDFRFGIDFNIEPYQMGAFADIARKIVAPKKFVLGFKIQYDTDKESQVLVTFCEKKSSSEPIIENIKWIFHNGEIDVIRRKNKKDNPLSVDTTDQSYTKFMVRISVDIWDMHAFDINFLSFWFQDILFINKKDKPSKAEGKAFSAFLEKHEYRELYWQMRKQKTYSIAPIRSKPKRTYDPIKETVASDGSEIPMFLKNLNMSNKQEWDNLKQALLSFGKTSGLFTDIKVRKLGKSASDPFQLQIKVKGPTTNLMDVGYGISQVLPILVRILTASNATFLMQQPEVHLHPKGQAELTSLLVNMIKDEDRKHSFIIETHSDYMIDRARIEIMRGKISPDDVSLIYMQPVRNKAKVHNISFDEQANMIGVPQGYRDFFLRERDALLGFED
ncbi:hypothetical protein SPBRAN_235 [uncultured Candidatus Thioglobus sp.]|nr:hypothetical protein SPBRAN_235 [uncultured Candidatus Thioglobus sp.]